MSISREEGFAKIFSRLENMSYQPEGVFLGALEAIAKWAENEGLIEDAQEWFDEVTAMSDVQDVADEDDDVDEDDDE